MKLQKSAVLSDCCSCIIMWPMFEHMGLIFHMCCMHAHARLLLICSFERKQITVGAWMMMLLLAMHMF